jgi:large subunit ribosomal protein L17
MLRNMVTSLLQHERIETTVPKAKEARRLAERIITLGKRGGVHNARLAARHVKNREVLQKVFGELKERYATRAGGYTRLMKGYFRRGDAADIAILELVDRPEVSKDRDAGTSDEKQQTEK